MSAERLGTAARALDWLLGALAASASAAADEQIAFSKSLGVEVFAEARGGPWCGSELKLRVVARTAAFFQSGEFADLIRRVGSRVLADRCAVAEMVLVSGFAQGSGLSLYSGQAARSDGWRLAVAPAATGAGPATVPASRATTPVADLLHAAERGDLGTVDRLVAKGVDVNARDASGGTALMIAAENGHALLVYSLLGKGADVNAQDAQGSTALARASRGGHALVLQALRDAGATDPGGSKPTPLSYERWENCRDKAAASVNAVEVGLGGLRREVERRCGEPPVPAPGAASGLGVRPTELLRSKAWKQKFADVTKGEHQAFVKRLDVASETVFEDGWIVGQGQAPHAGTIDEAALAIDPRTGRVYAAMMVDGKRILGFGFGESWADAPPSLQRWARARGLRESAARP